MEKKDGFFDDDPFWNIDTLMPKGAKNLRRPRPSLNSGAAAGETSSITSAGPARVPGAPETRSPALREPPADGRAEKGAPIPAFSSEPERICRPQSGLIRQVKIFSWPNRYAFFAAFRKNALAALKLPAAEAPFVPFFSFLPQFHQLNAAQLRYYLYWRASFMNGKPIKADFCYLMLFICEIINLDDVIEPRRGADLLSELWLVYRKSFPKLDKYLVEWLLDYCLIHEVLPKKKLFEALCPIGRKCSTLKEFYYTEEERAHPVLTLSEYSYKTGKYRSEQNADLFDRHIPAAMDAFFEYLKRREGVNAPKVLSELTVSRSAFDGAVCVCNKKKKLEITYTPITAAGAPPLVTEAEKLSENYVRAALGIRARFPTVLLDVGMKSVIEEYFSRNLPSSLTKKATEEFRYDDRYEPQSGEFSLEEAKRIEESSLEVARKLGQAYEGQDSEAPEIRPDRAVLTQSEEPRQEPFDAVPQTPPANAKENDYEAQYKAALEAIRKGGGAAFASYASTLGLLPHTLADEINEEALLRIGDIVLVGDDGGIELLPDYIKEVDEWISNSN